MENVTQKLTQIEKYIAWLTDRVTQHFLADQIVW